jgi:hypothetical protein
MNVAIKQRQFYLSHILGLIVGIELLFGCTPLYYLETYPASPTQARTYSTFQFINTNTETPKQGILRFISTDFPRRLELMGLTSDSLRPHLLFLIRWEEHLIRADSSDSKKESPLFQKAGNPSLHYEKETFIRMQAIDAIHNELIWSVKIYSEKKNGLQLKHVSKVVDGLIRSFSNVRSNSLKPRRP